MRELRDQLDRMEGKLDKHGDAIADINVTLGKQHVVLDEHMRRTDALEKIIEPIRVRHERMNGVLKLLGLIAAMGGVVEGSILAIDFVRSLIHG